MMMDETTDLMNDFRERDRVARSLQEIPDPPCEVEGGCPDYERCKLEVYPCRAFSLYQGYGKVVVELRGITEANPMTVWDDMKQETET